MFKPDYEAFNLMVEHTVAEESRDGLMVRFYTHGPPMPVWYYERNHLKDYQEWLEWERDVKVFLTCIRKKSNEIIAIISGMRDGHEDYLRADKTRIREI